MKIAFGIQSFGLGHYTRSIATINYLLEQGHSVKIFASGMVYDFLREKNYDVEFLSRIVFKFKDNHINYPKSILHFLLIDTPRGFKNGYLKARRVIREYRPDVIISDFEIHTAKVAGKLGIPLVSIDNLHAISHTDAGDSVPKKYQKYKFNQKIGLKYLLPRAEHFFILSFFNTKPLASNVTVIPPILRKEIIEAKNTPMKDHIIVYMSINTNHEVIRSLRAIPDQHFIVYGYDVEKTEGNLEYKKYSLDTFIHDLASSRGAISNGGFSFMSEVIFLGKPLLSIPIEGQFEMIMNCTYLSRLGFGTYVEKISEQGIRDYLANIEAYRENLKEADRKDNIKSFKMIESKIKELTSPRLGRYEKVAAYSPLPS